MATGTIRLHRVLRATPSASIGHSSTPTRWRSGFRRTASPARFITWTPKSAAPTGCRSRTSRHGNGHSFGGEYLELVPVETIRYTDRFDDPNLPGEMQTTVTLKPVSCGTEIERRAGRDARGRSRSRCATSAGRSRSRNSRSSSSRRSLGSAAATGPAALATGRRPCGWPQP